MKYFAILSLCCGFWCSAHAALEFPLSSANQQVVGEPQIIVSGYGDNFDYLARKYYVGFYELVEANPDLNPSLLPRNTEVVIPSQYILPAGTPHQGLVVNMAEMRLYYYPSERPVVYTMPAGVGRFGWLPPNGESTVTKKEENPTWHPPAAVKKYVWEDRHIKLPDEVPPGPENPLGKHVIWLSLRGFLIHGTNDPSGIGKRSSAGCIRLYPEDAKWLYEHLPVGAPVYFINQPVKVGIHHGKVYLEAHQALQEDATSTQNSQNHVDLVYQTLTHYEREGQFRLDWTRINQMLKERSGIPEVVSLHRPVSKLYSNSSSSR